MRNLSFEDVVAPAREVVNTVTTAAGAAGGAAGAAVSEAVAEFEARAGAALADLGLDASAIEALGEDARNALAALLSVKDDLVSGLARLQEVHAQVTSVAEQPLGTIWRGENVALIRDLWQRQEDMRSAALNAVGLISGLLDALSQQDRDEIRARLTELDPRFGDWLDHE